MLDVVAKLEPLAASAAASEPISTSKSTPGLNTRLRGIEERQEQILAEAKEAKQQAKRGAEQAAIAAE